MAVYVVPNLTTVHTCDNLTDVTGTGTPVLDTEIFIQGTGAIGSTIRNALRYVQFNPTGSWDMSATDTHIYFWAYSAVYAQLATQTNGGLRLRITDTGGNYREWYIAGSDTWEGQWKCFVQNINAAATNSSGTLNLAAIDHVQIYFWNTVNTRNVVNCWVDAVRFGTGLTAYGDTSFNFGYIASQDGLTANKYGIIQNVDGVYSVQGRLQIGDNTSTYQCNFDSQDEIVIFAQRPVSTTLYRINFVGNATGSTDIDLGIKVGTGDTAVGRNGTLIQGANSNVSVTIDFDDGSVENCRIYGSTFRYISGGLSFGTNTAHEFIGNTVDQSGLFDPGQSIVRNSTFSGTTDASRDGSALLWNSNINIKNCSFLANTDSTNNPHAIKHTTAGTYSYDNLNFSGNDYDIDNNSTGLVTINAVNGANPSTYENTGAGASTVINNSVSIQVTGVTQGTQCYMVPAAGGSELLNTTAATLVSGNTYRASGSINYSGDTAVVVRAREMGYQPFESTGTITSTGLSVTAVWLIDPTWELVVSGITISFTNPTTITRASGDFSTDGWLNIMGQVTVEGAVNAANNGTFTIATVGTNTLTISGATLTTEANSAGVILRFTRISLS